MLTIRPEYLGLKPGQLVVDLGCGHGRHVQALAWEHPVRILGLDLDPDSAAASRKGLHELLPADDPRCSRCLLAAGDCLDIPLPDNSADHLICSEVLEHLCDYNRAVQEIRRVLKPGGTLAVSVPRFWPERVCWALSRDYQHEPGGHVRIFQASSLRLEIQRLGFRFRRSHHAHALHAPYWWLKCLHWSRREDWPPVRLYHRLLVWDMLDRPWLTRSLERVLNPVMGKSVVMYFTAYENR
ncbi:class I SAM-dependent methyltransferase [Desulfovermiculus halophilus]|jgi:SAM-dependent methyltransferase|uniref:class I SAM-dependent methyltransferase n=1 Tax=Desulfovermiculus halophilus TaxID=339722 RepID=UPI0004837793|nr:class I SAM-dependent methyltransferase [Desulfovermiculus halophilus]